MTHEVLIDGTKYVPVDMETFMVDGVDYGTFEGYLYNLRSAIAHRYYEDARVNGIGSPEILGEISKFDDFCDKYFHLKYDNNVHGYVYS